MGWGGGGIRILNSNNQDYYGDKEMTSYILNKFSEDNNIDKEYENIYDKLYIRNFIGFNNVIEMNKFIHFDFRSQIKGIFPNNIFFIIFGFFSLAVIIALMLFFNHKNTLYRYS